MPEKLVNSILQCNMTDSAVAGMLRLPGVAGLKRPGAILLRYNQGRFAHPPWFQYRAAPFLHCLLGMHLSTHFNFEQFQQMTPLNGVNIWEYILDRHAGRIGVKRRKPALENLERIFGATFRLANDVGFRAMSLRDLCRETGLSMGGLYGYITGKDQLAEMIEDVVRHATQALPQLFVDVKSPLDRLEAMIRSSIYLSEILQPWFYFVYMDSRVLQVEQRSMAKQSELYVQALLARTILEISPQPQGDPTMLASHCLALFQDWYVKRWKYRAAKVSVDDFADSTVRTVRGYLSAAG